VRLTLHALPLAVVRLAPDASVPGWATGGWFSSVTRTPSELSMICEARRVPDGMTAERGFVALAVDGPLPFDAVGVLASMTAPLAAEHLSILAVCTYDTDYVLVREADLDRAVAALEGAGHVVRRLERG